MKVVLHSLLLLLLLITGSSSDLLTRSDIRELTKIGAENAVKKAHQMTDIPIYPVATLYACKNKTYKTGELEYGLIYSSTKEINTSVGQDVSFHTFMTALHNPRSLLYTTRIDKPPYHGINCRGYYGTVCSGLVTYALGLTVTHRADDIPVEDCFELVDDQSAEGVSVADVLWQKGHVMLVTAVDRKTNGHINKIEYCESVHQGAHRVEVEGDSAFNQFLKDNKIKIYRYKELYKNINYSPQTEFVAVDGEKKTPFRYNDAICTCKGDKACFITGEEVVLNVFGKYKQVEIYKESQLYKTINVDKEMNIFLVNLPYGDYKARAVAEKKKSDYTFWKVIDVNVRIDSQRERIYFSSANATPVYYEFCNINGVRPTNKNRIYAAVFTETELEKGYVTVNAPKQSSIEEPGFPYVKVHFACDYGMVINKPKNWFDL